MSQAPLHSAKEYYADLIFKNLTSLTRSEETSLNFYGMELEKQNATETEFKKFSSMCADNFIDSYKKKKKETLNVSDAEVEKLLKKALEKTWEEYNGQN